jgi:hypothetical protein
MRGSETRSSGPQDHTLAAAALGCLDHDRKPHGLRRLVPLLDRRHRPPRIQLFREVLDYLVQSWGGIPYTCISVDLLPVIIFRLLFD